MRASPCSSGTSWMNEGFLRTRSSSVWLIWCIIVLQMLVDAVLSHLNEINRSFLMQKRHMNPNAVMMFRWIHEGGVALYTPSIMIINAETLHLHDSWRLWSSVSATWIITISVIGNRMNYSKIKGCVLKDAPFCRIFACMMHVHINKLQKN